MKEKKGQIDGLMNIIGPLIGIGIVLVVGFLIFSESKEFIASTQDLCVTGYTFNGNATLAGDRCYNSTNGTQASLPVAGTYAWNGTETTQLAMADIPGWLPIIVITVIGALLLAMVAYFRGR